MRVNSLRTLEDQGPQLGQGQYDRVSVAAPLLNHARRVLRE